MNTVVILPTYNERENIKTLLDSIFDVWVNIRGHSLTILVVDDKSPDGTSEVVKQYRSKHPNVILLTKEKEGLGSALLYAIAYALDVLHAKIIVQMDADLSHDPVSLPHFIKAINSGADFAVGSRYIEGGSIPDNWGWHRKLFSIVGNGIVRFGLGYTNVHDWTGGYRAYTEKIARYSRSDLSQYQGYVFQIAYLHKSILRGAKITEVPIRFTDRKFGHSKIAPSQYIRDVLGYITRQRFTQIVTGSFGKFLVVGSIGFIINTAMLEVFVHFGFHPVIGSSFGAEFAIISNFILNNSWTFGSRKVRGFDAIRKFLQFNATSFGAVLIQSGAVATGSMVFGVSFYRWFYLIGVGIGLLWNYTMYSKVIWKK
ncbi:MAG: glycosyltransferase family 2 protein [Candidatus Gottesmanbacteria bacterium]|nr:glycosyltransferase family 2 protein [Candidatus Gottesmanbacteria bacterium]